MNPHIDFDGTVRQAAQTAERALEQAGLHVLRSFELNGDPGTDRDDDPRSCTCRYAILLVYAESGPPAVVATHRLGDHARLEVLLDPNFTADASLVARIVSILTSASVASQ